MNGYVSFAPRAPACLELLHFLCYSPRVMRILAIETSCDETAVAVVRDDDGKFGVEKDLIASQMKTHAKYGGVVPEVAARMHMEALFPMLVEAGIQRDGAGIDAVAVTAGPGLVVALRVGVESAKTLSVLWNKPLVAVNHLEGHLASAWLSQTQPAFPVLSLLVSGGHTEIVLMRSEGANETLGSTRDDAAGEAFDKVAKLLGLGYPGGPEISRRAEHGRADAINLPRPMLDADNLDFSFSGLKTAVAREVRKWGQAVNGEFVEDMAASFQEAVVETLVTKFERALLKHPSRTVTLVGGVSANARLREAFNHLTQRLNVPAIIPERKYSTDNAAMIGVAGLKKLSRGETVDPFTLEADPHLALSSSRA